MQPIRSWLFAAAAFYLTCGAAGAAIESQTPTGDEALIRAQEKEFVDQFAKANARAIAALCTPTVVYVDENGDVHKGRQAVEDVYRDIFSQIGGEPIDIKIESLTFPAPGVAVEVGTAALPNEHTKTRYTVVHNKVDGKWQMANINEVAVPTNALDDLKQLDWLAGKWKATGDKGAIDMHANWDANHNFLYCRFLATADGAAGTTSDVGATASSQVIGLDRQSGRIVSWHFDRNGGHGRSEWIKRDGNWHIHGAAIEPDGHLSAANYVIHPIDANSFTWRSTWRMVDGKRLPGSTEVKVVRKN